MITKGQLKVGDLIGQLDNAHLSNQTFYCIDEVTDIDTTEQVIVVRVRFDFYSILNDGSFYSYTYSVFDNPEYDIVTQEELVEHILSK